MSGDDADRKDEDLLNQIDELKARMDRLMAGGTSTSNSALLTDAPRPSSPVVEAKPPATPPPPRTRVGDLLGAAESDSRDGADRRKAVQFPDEEAVAEEGRPADRPEERRDERREERPASSPPPGKPSGVDGSLIAVDDTRDEPRPTVASFDEMGSAVEQELARDTSVPPASARKGPDLASRFGPADEPVEAPVRPEEVPSGPVDEDVEPQEVEEIEDFEDFEIVAEEGGRRNVGAVVAIWIFTAVTSGGIAVLHFAGII